MYYGAEVVKINPSAWLLVAYLLRDEKKKLNSIVKLQDQFWDKGVGVAWDCFTVRRSIIWEWRYNIVCEPSYRDCLMQILPWPSHASFCLETDTSSKPIAKKIRANLKTYNREKGN